MIDNAIMYFAIACMIRLCNKDFCCRDGFIKMMYSECHINSCIIRICGLACKIIEEKLSKMVSTYYEILNRLTTQYHSTDLADILDNTLSK